MRRLGWPLLGAVTVLTYNTWVFWQVNGHRRIFDGYLSEFSASDQPHSFFFRGGDLVTAVITLVLVLRARHLARERGVASRWEVVAWLGLLLFALSTSLDAFSSMDCSPTLSHACRVAEETGRLSWPHYAHTWTSVGAQTGIVASMVAAYLALRLGPTWVGRGVVVRRLVLVLTVVEVAALVVMMAMLVLGAPGLGYPQALMVLVASLWFAVLGCDLAGAAGDSVVEPVVERSGVR
ncbi:DUF998 domain-containing protein [uncultured Friedmanniella sp.]|uniref:DUF998 domain-containing protein n=1 Tax=uncultured Friedmanniella sp. TaxID=335381 RepID=UPI0035CA64D4